MYLRDYLHDIPLKALKAIAMSLDVPVEYAARIKLINAVDRAFWDGSLTENIYGDLHDESKRVLSLLAFTFDAGAHEKALMRKTEKLLGITRSDTRGRIHELIPLAFAGGVNEDDNLYFCPRGIAEQVRKLLIEKAVSFEDITGPIPSTTPPNMLEDIFSFLAEAYKRPIPLTLMGNVKKNILDRIFTGSLTCTDPVLSLSRDHRDDFVIDYLKTKKLLEVDRRKSHASPLLGGWLKLSATERLRDIVSFSMKRILQDDHTIISFSGVISEIPSGSSFDMSEFAYFLHAWTMAPGGYTRLESRVRELLTVLYHLGMFSYRNDRFALTVTGERFFNGKSLPMDENTGSVFTIQPNFEVIIGPEVDLSVRFSVELLADRKNRDMVLTYEVTQGGIVRGIERGMTVDEIFTFLDTHSRTPLPQNVRFSVENWAGSYGAIFFEKITVMRFRDKSVCNGVMHLPEIAPYIKEQLSETVLAVSSEHIKKITEVLKSSGYQPETFGDPPENAVSNEVSFQPVGVEDILKDLNMPSIHNDFIFPDDLLPDGES